MSHHPEWKNELEVLVSSGQKTEIQAIAASSSEGVFIFGYLITKLKALSHGTDPYVRPQLESPTNSSLDSLWCSSSVDEAEEQDENISIEQDFELPEVRVDHSESDVDFGQEEESQERDKSYSRDSLESQESQLSNNCCSQDSLMSHSSSEL